MTQQDTITLCYNELLTLMRMNGWPLGLIPSGIATSNQIWLQNETLRYVMDVATGKHSYEKPDELPDQQTWMTFMAACTTAHAMFVSTRSRYDWGQ